MQANPPPAPTPEQAALAAAAHDIRNPLAAIIAAADALSEAGDLNVTQADLVAAVLESSLDLQKLAEDLLDLARSAGGASRLSPAPFLVGDALRQSVRLYTPSAIRLGALLQLEVDPALEVWALGDAGRIKQVFGNLLANAVRAPDRRLIAVRASAETAPPGVVRLRVEIADDGVGVPEAVRANLFPAFDEALRGGRGLGLAICAGLVAEFGGAIGHAAPPEGGALFWFELPLPRAAAPSEAAPPPPLPEPAPAAAEPLRLLCAEDNANTRTVLRAVLGAAGMEVDFVTSGDSAVAACAAYAYDVVLMDMRMPGMGGLAAIRALRAQAGGATPADIPILAVTGAAASETAAIEAAGAVRLTKPIRPAELIAAIRRVAAAPADAARASRAA